MENIFKSFLLIAAILFFNIGNAQPVASSTKPKIGLVLSGGGAKGIAHIGVLKVLEQAGITPDYITGTSMGSIIGALYAMGYTADEISELNRTTNWTELLSDNLQLNKVVMEEKYETQRYLLSFPIRNYQFKLPSGFIEGQKVSALFSEIAWPLTQDQNFDSLPIPFHCYSVDLISGQTYEHKKGDIVEAIRASMAIPSVFAPQSLDTMLLVDGGVALNFPVQQVKNMGADIIIGVYVGTEDNITKEDLFSFSDVLGHTIFIGGIIDSKKQIELADIIIEPDLKGLGSADFYESLKIEAYGEESALALLPELKALADSLDLKYTPARKIEKEDEIVIGDFEVESLRFLKPDFVIGNSGLRLGDKVTQKDIAGAVERLYGTRYFSKVTYKLKKRTNDYVLVFNAKEKTRAFLKLSPSYDNDRGVGLSTNLTLRNWGIPSSHFVFTVNIAENPAGRIDLTKFWGKRQRLMNFYFLNVNRDKLPYYTNGEEFGMYERVTSEAGVGFKYSMGLNSQIGIKGLYESNSIEPNSNLQQYSAKTDFIKFNTTGFAACSYYAVFNVDDTYYPKKGKRLLLQHKYSLEPKTNINRNDSTLIVPGLVNENQEAFHSIYGEHSRYVTVFDRLTLNFGANVGLNTDDAGVSGFYMLGGIHSDSRINYTSLAGFNFGEIIARNYASIHFNMRLEIIENLYFSAKSNIAYSTEYAGDMFEYLSGSKMSDYYMGYSAGFEYNSRLGPLRFMVGDNNQDGRVRWYISMGYPF